jgi:hypothetical protein
VPAPTAVTNPLTLFTVATAILSLLQAPVPPSNTTSFAAYVAVFPIHNGEVPLTEVTEATGIPELWIVEVEEELNDLSNEYPVRVKSIGAEPASTALASRIPTHNKHISIS